MSVNYDKARDKFMVRKTINGKRVYLGRYNTRAEADYVDLDNTLTASSVYESFLVPELVCDIDKPSLFERFLSFFGSRRG